MLYWGCLLTLTNMAHSLQFPSQISCVISMNVLDSETVWKTTVIDQKAKLEASWLRSIVFFKKKYKSGFWAEMY